MEHIHEQIGLRNTSMLPQGRRRNRLCQFVLEACRKRSLGRRRILYDWFERERGAADGAR
jgi:hypothetical protein